MTYQVKELLLEDLSSPYANWFNTLSPDVAAKVVTAKLRMQQGNLSSVEWFRGFAVSGSARLTLERVGESI